MNIFKYLSLLILFSMIFVSCINGRSAIEVYNTPMTTYKYIVFYANTVSDTVEFECRYYDLYATDGHNVLKIDGEKILNTTAPIKVLENVK